MKGSCILMTVLLELKEKIKAAYAQYTIYFDIVLKALLSFMCFYWISMAFDTDSVFSNISIMLIVALLCSVLPLRVIPMCSAAFIVGHAFMMGIDTGAVTLVVLLVLLFLFLRFVPDDSLGLILMPIGMYFGMPALIPICFGLRRRPDSMVAVGGGCITYYLIDSLTRNKAQLEVLEPTEYMERLTLLLGGLVSDSGLIVNLLAICAVVVIVYAIRRLGFKHSFTVATVVGACTYVFFIILGNAVVDTNFNVPMIMIGSVFSTIVALILQFLFLSVDYSRTETMEFEDDDYYYFVKAIPKQYAYKNRVREIENNKRSGDTAQMPEDFSASVNRPDEEVVDFESRLEDSLKNL